MTLEQLRIFLAVAKHLHFTRAAEELFITQPAVSAAINSLEKEYGIKLFHRVGRRIEIAEAGRFLEAEAQRILDQVVLVERGLRELNGLQRGELRLGASLTVGNYWLPNYISQFKRQYPGIEVSCSLSNAEGIWDGTASGLFDMGLVTGSITPSLQYALTQKIVGSDRLQVVVGKGHPWYKRGAIAAEELKHTGWIMREPGSGIQQVFEKMLQQLGIEPSQLKIDLVLTTGEMVKLAIEESSSAAPMSELMLKKELQLGSLKTVTVLYPQQGSLAVLDMVQPVLMLTHRERFQSRVAVAFQQLLLGRSEEDDCDVVSG